MSKHKNSVRVGLLVLLTAVVSAVVVSGAQASPGWMDPHNTGCDRTAYTLKAKAMYDPTNGAYIGLALLRYSTGCQTEWVTVYYSSGYFPWPSVWNQNQSGTDVYTSDDAPYQGTVWTGMLYNMRYRAGCGGVQVYRTINQYYPTPGKYLAWYYIGCA